MFKEMIGAAPVYEQLAEECTELAKEALKCARIIRNENPTPVSISDAQKRLTEEFTDVILCAEDLNLHADPAIRMAKFTRWYNRLEEVKYAGKA